MLRMLLVLVMYLSTTVTVYVPNLLKALKGTEWKGPGAAFGVDEIVLEELGKGPQEIDAFSQTGFGLIKVLAGKDQSANKLFKKKHGK